MKPDEIIESGFASLKAKHPSQSHEELVKSARRRVSNTRIKRTVAGVAGCLMIAGILAIAFKPTSALAALRESARLTAAQPIVHVHIERADVVANPTAPPWPQVPPLDIWRFSDRYFRKQGSVISELFRNGELLAYDNRFAEGFKSSYDAANDRFWKFDGTIGIELGGIHRDPPTVHDASLHGDRLIEYGWEDIDPMHIKHSDRIYVDRNTKLVRFSQSDSTSTNGDKSHGSGTVEYPSPVAALREAPRFPPGLKFRTSADLLADFHKRIAVPDQTKTLSGIRNTLYGVVLYPNIPDGIGVDVITRGGAGPDFGSGHQPEIVDGELLDTKRTDWLPQFVDRDHARFGRNQVIDGREYVVNQSSDLLTRAPSKITVRVPIWRLGSSSVEQDGKVVHPHIFVGYVTFTTSKIFCSVGEADFSYYNDFRLSK